MKWMACLLLVGCLEPAAGDPCIEAEDCGASLVCAQMDEQGMGQCSGVVEPGDEALRRRDDEEQPGNEMASVPATP